MATIRSKTRKDGSKSYLAQIIRRNFKYQESRTFDKESLAKKWAAKREKEIDADIAAGIAPKKLSANRVTNTQARVGSRL